MKFTNGRHAYRGSHNSRSKRYVSKLGVPKPKETDIQKQILEYLIGKGKMCWRNNTGSFRTERGGFYKAGVPGSPDIICVEDGQFVGLEVKRPGGKLNENQKKFKERLEKHGGKYLVVTGKEDLKIK